MAANKQKRQLLKAKINRLIAIHDNPDALSEFLNDPSPANRALLGLHRAEPYPNSTANSLQSFRLLMARLIDQYIRQMLVDADLLDANYLDGRFYPPTAAQMNYLINKSKNSITRDFLLLDQVIDNQYRYQQDYSPNLLNSWSGLMQANGRTQQDIDNRVEGVKRSDPFVGIMIYGEVIAASPNGMLTDLNTYKTIERKKSTNPEEYEANIDTLTQAAYHEIFGHNFGTRHDSEGDLVQTTPTPVEQEQLADLRLTIRSKVENKPLAMVTEAVKTLPNGDRITKFSVRTYGTAPLTRLTTTKIHDNLTKDVTDPFSKPPKTFKQEMADHHLVVAIGRDGKGAAFLRFRYQDPADPTKDAIPIEDAPNAAALKDAVREMLNRMANIDHLAVGMADVYVSAEDQLAAAKVIESATKSLKLLQKTLGLVAEKVGSISNVDDAKTLLRALDFRFDIDALIENLGVHGDRYRGVGGAQAVAKLIDDLHTVRGKIDEERVFVATKAKNLGVAGELINIGEQLQLTRNMLKLPLEKGFISTKRLKLPDGDIAKVLTDYKNLLMQIDKIEDTNNDNNQYREELRGQLINRMNHILGILAETYSSYAARKTVDLEGYAYDVDAIREAGRQETLETVNDWIGVRFDFLHNDKHGVIPVLDNLIAEMNQGNVLVSPNSLTKARAELDDLSEALQLQLQINHEREAIDKLKYELNVLVLESIYGVNASEAEQYKYKSQVINDLHQLLDKTINTVAGSDRTNLDYKDYLVNGIKHEIIQANDYRLNILDRERNDETQSVSYRMHQADLAGTLRATVFPDDGKEAHSHYEDNSTRADLETKINDAANVIAATYARDYTAYLDSQSRLYGSKSGQKTPLLEGFMHPENAYLLNADKTTVNTKILKKQLNAMTETDLDALVADLTQDNAQKTQYLKNIAAQPDGPAEQASMAAADKVNFDTLKIDFQTDLDLYAERVARGANAAYERAKRELEDANQLAAMNPLVQPYTDEYIEQQAEMARDNYVEEAYKIPEGEMSQNALNVELNRARNAYLDSINDTTSEQYKNARTQATYQSATALTRLLGSYAAPKHRDLSSARLYLMSLAPINEDGYSIYSVQDVLNEYTQRLEALRSLKNSIDLDPKVQQLDPDLRGDIELAITQTQIAANVYLTTASKVGLISLANRIEPIATVTQQAEKEIAQLKLNQTQFAQFANAQKTAYLSRYPELTKRRYISFTQATADTIMQRLRDSVDPEAQRIIQMIDASENMTAFIQAEQETLERYRNTISQLVDNVFMGDKFTEQRFRVDKNYILREDGILHELNLKQLSSLFTFKANGDARETQTPIIKGSFFDVPAVPLIEEPKTHVLSPKDYFKLDDRQRQAQRSADESMSQRIRIDNFNKIKDALTRNYGIDFTRPQTAKLVRDMGIALLARQLYEEFKGKTTHIDDVKKTEKEQVEYELRVDLPSLIHLLERLPDSFRKNLMAQTWAGDDVDELKDKLTAALIEHLGLYEGFEQKADINDDEYRAHVIATLFPNENIKIVYRHYPFLKTYLEALPGKAQSYLDALTIKPPSIMSHPAFRDAPFMPMKISFAQPRLELDSSSVLSSTKKKEYNQRRKAEVIVYKQKNDYLKKFATILDIDKSTPAYQSLIDYIELNWDEKDNELKDVFLALNIANIANNQIPARGNVAAAQQEFGKHLIILRLTIGAAEVAYPAASKLPASIKALIIKKADIKIKPAKTPLDQIFDVVKGAAYKASTGSGNIDVALNDMINQLKILMTRQEIENQTDFQDIKNQADFDDQYKATSPAGFAFKRIVDTAINAMVDLVIANAFALRDGIQNNGKTSAMIVAQLSILPVADAVAVVNKFRDHLNSVAAGLGIDLVIYDAKDRDAVEKKLEKQLQDSRAAMALLLLSLRTDTQNSASLGYNIKQLANHLNIIGRSSTSKTPDFVIIQARLLDQVNKLGVLGDELLGEQLTKDSPALNESYLNALNRAVIVLKNVASTDELKEGVAALEILQSQVKARDTAIKAVALNASNKNLTETMPALKEAYIAVQAVNRDHKLDGLLSMVQQLHERNKVLSAEPNNPVGLLWGKLQDPRTVDEMRTAYTQLFAAASSQLPGVDAAVTEVIKVADLAEKGKAIATATIPSNLEVIPVRDKFARVMGYEDLTIEPAQTVMKEFVGWFDDKSDVFKKGIEDEMNMAFLETFAIPTDPNAVLTSEQRGIQRKVLEDINNKLTNASSINLTDAITARIAQLQGPENILPLPFTLPKKPAKPPKTAPVAQAAAAPPKPPKPGVMAASTQPAPSASAVPAAASSSSSSTSSGWSISGVLSWLSGGKSQAPKTQPSATAAASSVNAVPAASSVTVAAAPQQQAKPSALDPTLYTENARFERMEKMKKDFSATSADKEAHKNAIAEVIVFLKDTLSKVDPNNPKDFDAAISVFLMFKAALGTLRDRLIPGSPRYVNLDQLFARIEPVLEQLRQHKTEGMAAKVLAEAIKLVNHEDFVYLKSPSPAISPDLPTAASSSSATASTTANAGDSASPSAASTRVGTPTGASSVVPAESSSSSSSAAPAKNNWFEGFSWTQSESNTSASSSSRTGATAVINEDHLAKHIQELKEIFGKFSGQMSSSWFGTADTAPNIRVGNIRRAQEKCQAIITMLESVEGGSYNTLYNDLLKIQELIGKNILTDIKIIPQSAASPKKGRNKPGTVSLNDIIRDSSVAKLKQLDNNICQAKDIVDGIDLTIPSVTHGVDGPK